MKKWRILLFPFAVIYNCVTFVRNKLYDFDVFKSTKFDTPTISVGNLSVGGTGKTPHIELLIKLLKNSYKISTLSRGYGRKTKGFVLADAKSKSSDIGDEPMQFYNKFHDEVNVAVCEKRVFGVSEILKKTNSNLILLDDAFQHRAISPKVNILLTKYNDLFVNDFVLPAGNLRESRSGAGRADAIIVTKCPDNILQNEIDVIRKKLNKYDNVYFSFIKYSSKIVSKNNSLNLGEIKNNEFLLVTGIASPKPLIDFLKSKNIKLEHLKYSDHHNFSDKEIKFIQSKGKKILTTEKDFTRLRGLLSDLFYISIEVEIKNDSKFKDFIKSSILEV